MRHESNEHGPNCRLQFKKSTQREERLSTIAQGKANEHKVRENTQERKGGEKEEVVMMVMESL